MFPWLPVLLAACADDWRKNDGDDDRRSWEEFDTDADTDADADTDTDADTDADTDTDTGTDGRARDGDRVVYTADEGDGWLEVAFTDVRDGTAGFAVYADGVWRWGTSSDLPDRDLQAWVAVDAGHEYVFEVQADREFSCDLAITHHAIVDAYEPNDTWDSATDLGDGGTAWLHAGIGDVFTADEDWYRITSDGRPFVVSVTDVPSDIEMMVEVWDPADMEWAVTWESASYEGTDVGVDVDPDHAGTYLVHVTGYGVTSYGVGDVAPSLLAPYTLTVN